MKTRQGGFSVVQVLLVLVILGIIGFTGWFVWKSQSTANQSLDSSGANDYATVVKTSTASSVDTSATASKTITIDNGKATLAAPESWAVVQGTNNNDGELPTTTITAPSKVLYVSFARLGGLGGYCVPDENKATIEELKITALPSDSTYSLVEFYISDGVSQGAYKAFLMKTATAEKLEDGANICDAYMGEILRDFKGSDSANALLGIYSATFDGAVEKGTKITKAAYDAFISSAEYKAARSVLLSLK